jgi:hypothetical protein
MQLNPPGGGFRPKPKRRSEPLVGFLLTGWPKFGCPKTFVLQGAVLLSFGVDHLGQVC